MSLEEEMSYFSLNKQNFKKEEEETAVYKCRKTACIMMQRWQSIGCNGRNNKRSCSSRAEQLKTVNTAVVHRKEKKHLVLYGFFLEKKT